MLQRGLLTNAEQQQQQQQPPYDTTTRAGTETATHEINLSKEQEHLSNKRNSNRQQDAPEEYRERINCLPIIELPQIKIEQDVEYMEGIEEEQSPQELQINEEFEENSEEPQAMEVEAEADAEELSIKPVPQLLEPTSILKTSLLTGAANTLATLTAAAEQIARMPNESLTKNYPYFKEENKRTYTVEEEQTTKQGVEENRMCASSTTTNTTTTYTSILQTALMSKRPATLNVAATSSSTSTSLATACHAAKTLHVRTPDQVLKTAVTLATLGEIAAQQEQQQQQQQQLQQSQQQQQPHILVVPQVQPTLRKMCTLPFKKLNFANVTSSSSTATCLTNTASSNNSNSNTPTTTTPSAAAAATTTTITNNYLGSNIKTNTNLTNSSCILNTNNQAASNNRETTTATFFDTNNIINNVTICSNSSNSNSNTIMPFKSQAMATQTLKIPTIKPQLVTTQTQTEEVAQAHNQSTTNTSNTNNNNNNSASSLQTASCSGLLRTAVSATTKMLTQNSLNTSLSTTKFPLKTKILANENVATAFAPATKVADPVVGNIIKHVSHSGSTLAKMNVIQNKTAASSQATTSVEASADNANSATNTATNVTVVVFETLLPED